MLSSRDLESPYGDLTRTAPPPITMAKTKKADLLTPGELVERWRGAVAEKTLRNWRNRGRGPVSTTIGRRVFYALPDVVRYERENRKTATG